MTGTQPEALEVAGRLTHGIRDTKTCDRAAALLRTQHAMIESMTVVLEGQHEAIERKDALLRQALETWDTVCNALGWDEDHMAAFAEIRKELSQ